MAPDTATEEDLAPLVLELARALRARHVHPSGHPVVADSIRRAAAIWRVLAEGSDELGFAVKGEALARANGAALTCVGALELALELSTRGARGLVLRGPAEVRDLELLIETLAREPADLAAAGGAAAALKAAGALAVELVGTAPAPAPAPTPKSDAPPPAPARPVANDPLAQQVAELVRLLGELERCDDVGGYNLLANKLEVCVDDAGAQQALARGLPRRARLHAPRDRSRGSLGRGPPRGERSPAPAVEQRGAAGRHRRARLRVERAGQRAGEPGARGDRR